jgi:HD-like signal output (HDOD) protein
MVLGEFVHESWQKIQELVEKQHYSFLEAEEEVIGVNHADLGGEIALNWKFPEEILRAIAFHHRPDLLADNDAVPWIVYLANQVCHIMGIGVGTDALSYRAVGDVAGRLDLKQRDLEDMMAELHMKLQGAKELVSIVSENK